MEKAPKSPRLHMKASKKTAHHQIAPVLAKVDAAFLNAALARERRYRGLAFVPKRAKLDAELAAVAIACFGTAAAAAQWLSTPAHGLCGRVPLEIAQSVRGSRRVITLIQRIDYGIAL